MSWRSRVLSTFHTGRPAEPQPGCYLCVTYSEMGYLPARRAAAVDPVESLTAE